MLLPLLLNNVLDTAPGLAFIGPTIDDLTFPEDITITDVDFTPRFTGATTYVLIGTLPTGMVFTNGVLSGTPADPGLYGPFIIRAS